MPECTHDPDGLHRIKFSLGDLFKVGGLTAVPLVAILGFWVDMRVFKSQFDDHREAVREDRAEVKDYRKEVRKDMDEIKTNVTTLGSDVRDLRRTQEKHWGKAGSGDE